MSTRELFWARLAQAGWRPAMGFGIVLVILVNGVALPLLKLEPVDYLGFAAMITACAPVMAVRAWEKKVGTAQGGD